MNALSFLLVIILYIIVFVCGFAACALFASGKFSELYDRIHNLKKQLREKKEEAESLRLQVNNKWRPSVAPIIEDYCPEEQYKAVENIKRLAQEVSEQETNRITVDEKLAEQNRLSETGKYRFYFCESSGEYLLGKRVGNFYYARWSVNAWTWCMSKYLPWGETVNGFTFTPEPVEIGADEFFSGWMQALPAYR